MKYAFFAKDGRSNGFIFTVTAESSYKARVKIRETGFSAYLDPNSWIFDEIIDLDDTETAR